MGIRKVGLILDRFADSWIVLALAEKELDVILYNPSIKHLEEEQVQLEAILDNKIAKWAITESEKKVILSHIKLETNIETLIETDLVIESIKEIPSVKLDVISRLDSMLPDNKIIACNTSIVSVTEIAKGTSFPERIIGVHFSDNIVEIIPGELTSNDTSEKTTQFIKSIEKEGIFVHESPGFITTRLRLRQINEAIMILSEGVASARDIDHAIKIGLGLNEGPLEMADRFGLDYILDLMEQLSKKLGENNFTPCPLLREFVESGRLGKRCGEGFFLYDHCITTKKQLVEV